MKDCCWNCASELPPAPELERRKVFRPTLCEACRPVMDREVGRRAELALRDELSSLPMSKLRRLRLLVHAIVAAGGTKSW